ncbi:pyridine nucleotide-disulfide oxidoreductase domain-containing protein [Cardiosporidium cionae]|uniref:Pyridine nucleotide-disulfide oxidoreductase domain-containing protein n=1 Tax=Cardiosporidium cionae TaxID=476202 RepID=A0ABQ7J702_9APIC|nr:pyridine nucleotide-disulfide oxidoreductase domain-containing protein [Cardiosporidium cionae]|eukprot:KAF8819766.1 pyridine nucleotide-disulfide oxidoreductase domain-containing protein [Cardiosporidium cionae]
MKRKEAVLLSYLDGKFYCTGNSCSHYGAPLHKGTSTKSHVTCPWHDAEFDLKTGKCINGPALNAIPVYSVKIKGEKVVAALPLELKNSSPFSMVKRDPNDTRVFVIVGSGAAALTACETLRQDGYTGRIVMLTKEAHPPYDRPVLSKNLKAEIENITLRDAAFLANADIEFRPNTTVKRVNADKNCIELANGENLQYDKVLVATGAEPRVLNIPGNTLENIFVLRRPEDTAKIANFAKRNSRVVVIGSSFIGMEVAAALRKREAKVTVIGMESVPFERVLGSKVGAVFKNMLEEQGVEYIPKETHSTFLFGTFDLYEVILFTLDALNKIALQQRKYMHVVVEISEIKDKFLCFWIHIDSGSRGAVNGVELSNGEVIQADAVVLGAGVIPNAKIVDGVSKSRDGSIEELFLICLLHLFPSSSNEAPNFYAAGDIATFPYFKSGDNIRIEHWDVAMQHGRIAAKNMNGQSIPYNSIPFFWTMLFGKSLRYAGYCHNFDDVICEGDLENYRFVAYYVKNERIVAAATMGMDPAAVAICEALKLNLMPSVSEIRLGFANSTTIIEKLKDHNKRKLPKQKN